MSTAIVETQQSRWMEQASSPNSSVRALCWLSALAMGAAQAWATRFENNPDGVSYLDVANAYLRHDWHNAVNTYWSPLYSWSLGFFLAMLKPSPYWVLPTVHLVNFLIYLVAVVAFDFFLATVIADRTRHDSLIADPDQTTIPKWLWWVLGYSLFLSCSIKMIGVGSVSPDQYVAAAVYTATALLLRIRGGAISTRSWLALGAVLGFAYLSKGIMFLVAFAFLAAAALAAWRSGQTRGSAVRATLISTAVFLAISAPFCIALSTKVKHPTFGETGKWNYVFFANTSYKTFSQNPQLKHPTRKVFDEIPAYAFRNEPGTFPLWYEPPYWQDGIKPRLEIKRQLVDCVTTLTIYTIILVNPLYQGVITAFVLVLVGLMDRPGDFLFRLRASWPLLVPGAATLALYFPVHVEARLVAPFFLLLWIAAFAAEKLPMKLHRVLVSAVFGLAVLLALGDANQILLQIRKTSRDEENVRAALDLKSRGLKSGDKIALLWVEDEAMHAGAGSYVAQLAGLRIQAEMIGPERFWSAPPAVRQRALAALASTGSRMVLELGKPPVDAIGWENISRTDWYFHWLA